MTTISRSFLFSAQRILVVAALSALWFAEIEAADYTVLRGAEREWPHAVLVVPLPPHGQSIGIADQISTLPIERGTLTIVETDGAPDPGDIAESLAGAGASGENRPDWLWIHYGAVSKGDEVAQALIRLAGNDAETLEAALETALDSESAFAFDVPDRIVSLSGEGVATFEYPRRTPLSRQVRHTRQLAVALLREAGMISPEVDFEWERLGRRAGRLVALYDADGTGGSGPGSLERIVDATIENAGIYRVCGEDIRDGALGPAATSIFPGGSGRGIGTGLQASGRKALDDYIASGGGYLGVCAGAYFAGSGLDVYLHAVNLSHSPPWRRGRGMVEIELTSEGKKLFGNERTVLETRYANGPVFLPEDQEGGGDPDFVVLATFKTPSTDPDGIVREEMVGQAAIGSRTYGDGRILVISPHPESHAEHDAFVGRAISWTMGPD
ncbi:MAG: BPL-N domain-containing protein [Verrucomicrobiales bacterium]